MNALVAKIIDNLQVVIKNIHVRFEDNKSHPQKPFAVGLTLSNLSAVSTDANWVEAFIEDSKAPTHKLLKLDSLALYWTPSSESFMNLPSEEFLKKFSSLVSYWDIKSLINNNISLSLYPNCRSTRKVIMSK